jgi:multidrug efflux pump subunit AcrB
VNGHPAVVLSATVESDSAGGYQWAVQARQVMVLTLQPTLSDGLDLQVVLDQSQYVQQRLNGVIGNLILWFGCW